MKVLLTCAALPALLLAAAPAAAVSTSLNQTFQFSGTCTDCQLKADGSYSTATATLVVQNYIADGTHELTNANFVSFTYSSNINGFTSSPDTASDADTVYRFSNTLSGVLGTAPGAYRVSFGEIFSYEGNPLETTTFDTYTDATFNFYDSYSGGCEGLVCTSDQGVSGFWNGTPATNGAVPEPATWASMIAGFAMVGAGMRRRRAKVSIA